MPTSFLTVLKNAAFRNLWLAQITSQISLNMLNFVLAIRVYEITHSNTAVSSMLLTFGIPAVFMGVIAGGVVDQYDKRSILILCNAVRVVLFMAFFSFSDSLVVLYVLSVGMSIATQLFIPAEGPAIPQVVPHHNLLSANSLFAVSFYLSTMLGFVLAGPLVRQVGYHPAYLIMGGLMLLATYFVYLLPPIRPAEQKKREPLNMKLIARTIHQGISFINSNSRVKQSLLLMTVSQALIATLSVLAPGFADKLLAIDLADASYLVMGPAAIGLVAGALLVAVLGARYLKGRLIQIGVMGTGVSLILLSLTAAAHKPSFLVVNNLSVAMGLLFLLGFFNSWISVPANTILQQDSEESMRGRVYGVLTSLTGGVSFLPVLVSGILADVLGVGRAMFYIGAIVVLGSISYRFVLKKTPFMK